MIQCSNCDDWTKTGLVDQWRNYTGVHAGLGWLLLSTVACAHPSIHWFSTNTISLVSPLKSPPPPSIFCTPTPPKGAFLYFSSCEQDHDAPCIIWWHGTNHHLGYPRDYVGQYDVLQHDKLGGPDGLVKQAETVQGHTVWLHLLRHGHQLRLPDPGRWDLWVISCRWVDIRSGALLELVNF